MLKSYMADVDLWKFTFMHSTISKKKVLHILTIVIFLAIGEDVTLPLKVKG